MSDSLWPHGLHGVDSLSLLQGIFPTQGSNPCLQHCRQIPYQLRHKGSPRILEWVAYPFSCRSSQARDQNRVSCIAGGFLTNWAIREALGFPEGIPNKGLPSNPTLYTASPSLHEAGLWYSWWWFISLASQSLPFRIIIYTPLSTTHYSLL